MRELEDLPKSYFKRVPKWCSGERVLACYPIFNQICLNREGFRRNKPL